MQKKKNLYLLYKWMNTWMHEVLSTSSIFLFPSLDVQLIAAANDKETLPAFHTFAENL